MPIYIIVYLFLYEYFQRKMKHLCKSEKVFKESRYMTVNSSCNVNLSIVQFLLTMNRQVNILGGHCQNLFSWYDKYSKQFLLTFKYKSWTCNTRCTRNVHLHRMTFFLFFPYTVHETGTKKLCALAIINVQQSIYSVLVLYFYVREPNPRNDLFGFCTKPLLLFCTNTVPPSVLIFVQ